MTRADMEFEQMLQGVERMANTPRRRKRLLPGQGATVSRNAHAWEEAVTFALDRAEANPTAENILSFRNSYEQAVRNDADFADRQPRLRRGYQRLLPPKRSDAEAELEEVLRAVDRDVHRLCRRL